MDYVYCRTIRLYFFDHGEVGYYEIDTTPDNCFEIQEQIYAQECGWTS